MHIEKATTMIIGNWERTEKTSVRMLASGCMSLLSLKKNKPRPPSNIQIFFQITT